MRGRFRGPKALDAGSAQIIHNPSHKGDLRADDHKVDVVLLAESDHGLMIGDREGHTFGNIGNSAVARRAVEFR